MSRKDYIAIAAILRAADLSREQRMELVSLFAELFQRDNARFRPDLFVRAVTAN